MPHSTKLSVISELNSIAIQNQQNNNHGIPNGAILHQQQQTFSELLPHSFHNNHHHHHNYHSHQHYNNDNNHLIDQHYQTRRKSTCSIADSIRSGKFIGNNISLNDEVFKLYF
jgi:hypothetical protein